jgi:hypothetical protein
MIPEKVLLESEAFDEVIFSDSVFMADLKTNVYVYMQLCSKLYVWNFNVQVTVALLLKRITAYNIQALSLKIEMNKLEEMPSLPDALLNNLMMEIPEVTPGVIMKDGVCVL